MSGCQLGAQAFCFGSMSTLPRAGRSLVVGLIHKLSSAPCHQVRKGLF